MSAFDGVLIGSIIACIICIIQIFPSEKGIRRQVKNSFAIFGGLVYNNSNI